jgi:hypothetical protein
LIQLLQNKRPYPNCLIRRSQLVRAWYCILLGHVIAMIATSWISGGTSRRIGRKLGNMRSGVPPHFTPLSPLFPPWPPLLAWHSYMKDFIYIGKERHSRSSHKTLRSMLVTLHINVSPRHPLQKKLEIATNG